MVDRTHPGAIINLRPQLGEQRSQSHETFRSGAPSPRIEHYDGEIPPALSPLDAFAAQGRLLARQLEESAQRDRRLSRLPPASVARSLSQPRPGYFRSPSSGELSRGAPRSLSRQHTHTTNVEVEEPQFRPQSEHPRLSAVSHLANEQGDPRDDRGHVHLRPPGDPRRFYAPAPPGVSLTGPPRTSSSDSASRLNVARHNLAPPISPFSRPSTGSRGPQPESSDDDYSSSNAGSTFSKPRKLSSGSVMSMPQSPMSSMNRSSRPRSPSINSETSNNGNHLTRPSFNFSRPLSRSSTSLSAPQMGAPNPPPPMPARTSASYIYAKYSLPRGRMTSRDSIVFSGLQTPHFEWQEPLFEGTEQLLSPTGRPRSARSPSPPPSRQSASSLKARSLHEPAAHERRLLTPEPAVSPSARAPPSPEATTPQSAPGGPSAPETSIPEDRTDATSSADSASTVRPQTARSSATASSVVTADDHVSKGIECHEKGSLKESTYHLRIAAKQNHPTGMLLYALACRHGWGMRPNQREGVQWLRKAVGSVGPELMDEANTSVPAKTRELQKTYRAQFALSVYELGVSHLNGWGIEQDKVLALRCFEIAGQWGDGDALAEAGYCYAEGVGCKKDLKKAARLYRAAEAKGLSMVGNSWIYKEKYMSDEEANASSSRGRGRANGTPDKKQQLRNKSRTRSLFQRKKSTTAEA
ncbi:hypothetical protein P168DRAFT_317829 [Aspergillus campestris IBT 28561]|uniref:Cell cycle inhibitor Nif1 n=1 Tax=Aspergillus campestris (strain IBT 28561) TaxID=1392248 RepID=A0A2I1D4H0_ASPC2|nr:uncharacterized protein P168DRAFT_317829 [Aspergillus campestris IBT 28561]PKY04781.1 hypothetical protein P168DRAFT_317829 [Aspergillus campestris IBT 28561]